MTAIVGGVTTTSSYDAQDRLVARGGDTFSYGANGELASSTVSEQTTSFTYDARGNLRHAGLPTPRLPVDYMIDGLQNRIGRKAGGTFGGGWIYAGVLENGADVRYVQEMLGTRRCRRRRSTRRWRSGS